MGTFFDDFVYGQPLPEPEPVPVEAVPETAEPFFRVEAPDYEAVKAAKQSQDAALTPEEIETVARHKAEQRAREAEAEEMRLKHAEEWRLLSQSDPEECHKWALVAMHFAEKETDDRKKTAFYADAERYIGYARRRIIDLGRERKAAEKEAQKSA